MVSSGDLILVKPDSLPHDPFCPVPADNAFDLPPRCKQKTRFPGRMVYHVKKRAVLPPALCKERMNGFFVVEYRRFL